MGNVSRIKIMYNVMGEYLNGNYDLIVFIACEFVKIAIFLQVYILIRISILSGCSCSLLQLMNGGIEKYLCRCS